MPKDTAPPGVDTTTGVITDPPTADVPQPSPAPDVPLTVTEGDRVIANALAALRRPFPADQVGKLPKPYRKDSEKGTCPECGGYHGLPAVHLDYVGHADVTARLLEVDPTWTWEPMGLDEQGLPAYDRNGNLWIRLTVCGVTRLGVGDAGNGKGVKEAIGDALRNAAMRFGVALELWAKGDRRYGEHAEANTDVEQPPERPGWMIKTLDLLASLDPVDLAKVRDWVAAQGLPPLPDQWTEEMANDIRHRAHQVAAR